MRENILRTRIPVHFKFFQLGSPHLRVAFLPWLPLRLSAPKPVPYALAPQTLGEHLKKRRHELGLLQRETAKRLRISHETYINWEKDRTRPYTPSWGRLIVFLGYDPSPAPRTLGESIAAKRREFGLTRKKLAALLGWDEGTVLRYERAEWQPNGERLQQLKVFLRSEPVDPSITRP